MNYRGSSKRVYAVLFVPMAAFMLLQSCDVLTDQKKGAAKSGRPGLHRFSITRLGVDIALDTQTGQLCRTWDWLATAKPPSENTALEMKPGQYAPLCLTLYEKYPSGTGEAQPIFSTTQDPQ
jgi:hypothetical protein